MPCLLKRAYLFEILKGYREYSDDLVETIYRCCLCGMCHAWCEGDYKLHEAILDARADIVELGKEPEAARQIKENILTTGNPFGLPAEERFNALEQQNLVKDHAEVLYYVGCDAAYHNPEIANAMIKILSQSGVDFTLLADETTSGKPLTALGYREEAKKTAQSLSEKICATGCKTLVTTCPSAYDAFKNDYPQMDSTLDGIEILHAVAYVNRLLDEGKIIPKKPLDRTITVHDSDYLCRFGGICREPRHLLQSIPSVTLKEMSWNGDKAFSCGEAGGIHGLLNPDLSSKLADRLLAEAASSGAAILTTTCPVTKKALLAASDSKMQIRDLVELVADSL